LYSKKEYRIREICLFCRGGRGDLGISGVLFDREETSAEQAGKAARGL
jgi:hypothetical protein